MADDTPQPKLSLAEVIHRILDSLGLHQDTAQNLHQLVDDNVASEAELADRNRNPWADKTDQEVVEAAIAGDASAAAEYRARKERQAQASAAPAPPVTPPATETGA